MMLIRYLSFFKRGRARQPNPTDVASELSLDELRQMLTRRGLILCTDGRRLLFNSRRPVLDDVLVRELQRHRPVLVRTLPGAQGMGKR